MVHNLVSKLPVFCSQFWFVFRFRFGKGDPCGVSLLESFLALLVRPGLNESLGLKLLKGAHLSRALTTLFVKFLVLVSMSFVEDISDQSWFRKASIHLVFVKSLKLLFIVAGLFSLAGLVVSLVVIDTIIGR